MGIYLLVLGAQPLVVKRRLVLNFFGMWKILLNVGKNFEYERFLMWKIFVNANKFLNMRSFWM
jgi:hypothetical protein